MPWVEHVFLAVPRTPLAVPIVPNNYFHYGYGRNRIRIKLTRRLSWALPTYMPGARWGSEFHRFSDELIFIELGNEARLDDQVLLDHHRDLRTQPRCRHHDLGVLYTICHLFLVPSLWPTKKQSLNLTLIRLCLEGFPPFI